MEHEYILYLKARHQEEIAAAAAASNKAARVAHCELAYRYSLAIARTSGASYVSGQSMNSDRARHLTGG
jgi:hypothetical protein